MDQLSAFRIEEYKALRAEILYQIGEVDKIKLWVAAGMGAYYAVVLAKLLSVSNDQVTFRGSTWYWLPPVIFPVLGFIRVYAYEQQLTLFSNYIQEIEKLAPSLPGWEHYYRQHRWSDFVWVIDEGYFFILFMLALVPLVIRWHARRTTAQRGRASPARHAVKRAN
jgi:hypothetical protein